jgi:ubiquinone/menaquinone biosynthesis C-methylase UbiE
MNLYSRTVLPWLCDWVMRDPRMTEYRNLVLADVSGDVLEIGFGTGLNLPHYPPHVRRISTVDPNPGMNKLAQKGIAESGREIDQRVIGGEQLPFDDATFDFVVSTWTLCSIPDAGKAAGEVYRVLKPGGRFLFVEHGLSDDQKVQRWQRRLNPIQRVLAGGCRLDLDVKALVQQQPFRHYELDQFLMERMPRTHGTMYRGAATK